MDRDKQGKEVLADIELTRIAVPKRICTISHIEYAVDRINWLQKRRDLAKGLKSVPKPPALRFSDGRLDPIDDSGGSIMKASKGK
jgi:tryptophanase